jgi:hypothetical protein
MATPNANASEELKASSNSKEVHFEELFEKQM